MGVENKLTILSEAAKYDVSCSSSGNSRKNNPHGTGNTSIGGICHSWADDGRCVSLLKVLFTNSCIYDCAYCANRISNDIPRATFTPRELADLTINFYKRNYIEGLFLSSGILRSPDYTMEQLIHCVKILRKEYRFNGYIHMKAIPGASSKLIYKAGLLADRLSVNIELPSEKSLKKLTTKKQKDILLPMNDICKSLEEYKEERIKTRNAPAFAPAGQSTQLIVGASPEHDLHIIKLSENLYNRFSLKRVYYSAFIPVSKDNRLPALSGPPLRREHRLYQADWLLRFYQFKSDEILSRKNPYLDELIDPKAQWALNNLHLFPIDIQKADYEMLLRIPGIGVLSARKIIKARRHTSLTFDHLKKLNIVLKRAQHFISCNGRMITGLNNSPSNIYQNMISQKDKKQYEQLTFF